VKQSEPAIDFVTAHDAGLAGLDDMAVPAIAADDGRLVVSHGVGRMPNNFRRFIQARPSAGVILISRQLSYHDATEDC
jgi:hypothetical protein